MEGSQNGGFSEQRVLKIEGSQFIIVGFSQKRGFLRTINLIVKYDTLLVRS